MRVISGKAKGRKLKAPLRARPLTNRAKEALFNILRDQVENASFLDLFAGSGQVGIEALSRGAEKAVFVELDRKAIPIIKGNLKVTGFESQAKVINLDAARSIGILNDTFDLIFLGAPYGSLELEKTLEALASKDLLKPNGWLIAEHRKQDALQKSYGELKEFRSEKYGETELTFYEHSSLSG